MHLHSGYYYYDYVVIGVQRPSWTAEILFWIGLLLSKEVTQLQLFLYTVLAEYASDLKAISGSFARYMIVALNTLSMQ